MNPKDVSPKNGRKGNKKSPKSKRKDKNGGDQGQSSSSSRTSSRDVEAGDAMNEQMEHQPASAEPEEAVGTLQSAGHVSRGRGKKSGPNTPPRVPGAFLSRSHQPVPGQFDDAASEEAVRMFDFSRMLSQFKETAKTDKAKSFEMNPKIVPVALLDPKTPSPQSSPEILPEAGLEHVPYTTPAKLGGSVYSQPDVLLPMPSAPSCQSGLVQRRKSKSPGQGKRGASRSAGRADRDSNWRPSKSPSKSASKSPGRGGSKNRGPKGPSRADLDMDWRSPSKSPGRQQQTGASASTSGSNSQRQDAVAGDDRVEAESQREGAVAGDDSVQPESCLAFQTSKSTDVIYGVLFRVVKPVVIFTLDLYY